MALRRMLQRLTAPVAELDDERLRDFCTAFPDATPMADLAPRQEATLVGQISSIRIVPRPDGSPWLEATITDGTGSVVAMWTGRKRIAGIRDGQRLAITGRGAPSERAGRLVFLNPRYELLGAG